jgi:5-methylcytosine-specific restriction endonuclease McrA
MELEEIKKLPAYKGGKILLEQGMSVQEVCEILGVTRKTVWAYNHKYWKLNLQKVMTSEEAVKAKQMLLDGLTYEEVGKALNRPSATIRDWNYDRFKLPYQQIQVEAKLIDRECVYCGKHFQVREMKLQHDAVLYCSKECSHWGSLSEEKLNSPYFRGLKWAYFSREYRKGKTCERCETDKKLTVHHIIPYLETKDNTDENLMVLCMSCHRKVESLGKRLFDEIGNWFKVRQRIKNENLKDIC